jgi:hypothetical protein
LSAVDGSPTFFDSSLTFCKRYVLSLEISRKCAFKSAGDKHGHLLSVNERNCGCGEIQEGNKTNFFEKKKKEEIIRNGYPLVVCVKTEMGRKYGFHS